jgi:hypothetical protein
VNIINAYLFKGTYDRVKESVNPNSIHTSTTIPTKGTYKRVKYTQIAKQSDSPNISTSRTNQIIFSNNLSNQSNSKELFDDWTLIKTNSFREVFLVIKGMVSA